MANSRAAIAEKLLDLYLENKPLFAKVDLLKDQLRDISAEEGAGFTEKVEGKGSIQVTKASVKKFKGTVPLCVPEVFLGLSEARRATLLKSGVIKLEDLYTQDRKASVTVKPE